MCPTRNKVAFCCSCYLQGSEMYEVQTVRNTEVSFLLYLSAMPLRCKEEVKEKLHACLTSALHEIEWSALAPNKVPETRWIRVWEVTDVLFSMINEVSRLRYY
jgi:hypothetical protein